MMEIAVCIIQRINDIDPAVTLGGGGGYKFKAWINVKRYQILLEIADLGVTW